MPSKKRKYDTFIDTAHPINNKTRRMLEEKIIKEYKFELKRKDTSRDFSR